MALLLASYSTSTLYNSAPLAAGLDASNSTCSGAAADLSQGATEAVHKDMTPHCLPRTLGRTCSEVGSGAWVLPLVKPMGTTIAGAPVGGGICGESLPARTTALDLKLWVLTQNSHQHMPCAPCPLSKS